MDIHSRSSKVLDLSTYSSADNTVLQTALSIHNVPEDQYILRMMIKSPWSDGYAIPKELEWIKETIFSTDSFQKTMFPDHPFVYVTVRAGEVKSVTDDQWHVDGFSMCVPHVPEQNYIWANCYPTEVLDQNFAIPSDFDPFTHNLHTFFQEHANEEFTRSLKSEHVSLIDPFIVHRRPAIPAGTNRCFFRISFVPIEIEDDTCMQNPLLPVKKYGRADIRKSLIPYVQNC